ncbi:Cof-type HAD-IIB family hydrolase [Paenibacillus thermotolerans]|uniref:Cof-type HAD-IIB family hydrolase n=1 Tax=Paenibacillus thermotolerans TaxID=3027807 RepID=UPI002368C36D|nr:MULTISPECIES: Cof-type HAD-IIB family hydrolase [unclassified Paenibacillus]
MYKMIAIDIDDTLLNDNLEVTPGTREALAEAIRQGAVVTLATGRMFASTKKVAEQLELNVPVITYQGALIKNLLDGEVLYERSLPAEAAFKVIRFAKERGLHLQAYLNDELYAWEENDKVKKYAEQVKVEYSIVTDFDSIAKQGSTKLLIIDEPSKLDELIPELKQLLGEQAHITKSKPHYLEILHPEATKGHALLHLAAYYGIDRSQTIAVGDSWNDREMIEAAGLGVAMANAVEPLKQVADFITLSNNEEGVRTVVDRFLLRGAGTGA